MISTSDTHHFPSINIIGAGIAGLSLACHLRRRRIPFTIFDAAPKPKGHNYGITISPWGYSDLIGAFEPKLDVRSFRELTAVDRLIGGQGVTTATTSSTKASNDFRASDMALREVLARGHNVNWNHKVIAAETVSEGLKLKFENGKDSTARITIDAGGERSGLSSLLLPEIEPEILPYAVYHGSRYISQSTFDQQYSDIFKQNENVRYTSPPERSSSSSLSSSWHLQLAKSHLTRDEVSSKAPIHSLSTDPDTDTNIVELRYTFSRPSITTTSDPLFNPTRAKTEATNIPETFFSETQTYLSSLPRSSPSLPNLLSSSTMHQDRILNWLLRLKPIQTDRLQSLASRRVIAIGDSVHSTPPVSSEGASLAMADAASVVGWIEDVYSHHQADDIGEEGVSEEAIMGFYARRMPIWVRAGEAVRSRLHEMHEMHETRGGGERGGVLSGRI